MLSLTLTFFSVFMVWVISQTLALPDNKSSSDQKKSSWLFSFIKPLHHNQPDDHHIVTILNSKRRSHSQSYLNMYDSIKLSSTQTAGEVHHRQLKLFLATIGSACAIFDLLETVFERLPSIHNILKPILRPKLGVFLLCVIHLLEILSDIISQLESRQHYLQRRDLDEQVTEILKLRFTKEEDAAMAHDRAAIALFGQDASLNFIYPDEDLDENGKPPERYSHYRGVKWSNRHHAWLVDGAYLGYSSPSPPLP